MNPDATFTVFTAPKRNSRHWTPGKVTWGELVGWMDTPGDRKEAGNYWLGELRETTVVHDPKKPDTSCTNYHRRKRAVVNRSAVSLDVDYPSDTFADDVELLLPYAGILHTTYSSTSAALRYRLLVPTDRPMAPDEYVHVAQSLMQMLGADQFDPSTDQPERYMFKPAAPDPALFHRYVLDGPALVVDEALSDFELDLTSKPMPKPHKNKRNPFEIDGVIGAFNKAYADWDLLIDTYDLPYEKVDDGRYQLIGAVSMAGMGPVQDTEGLVYSHHSTDPAFGKTCSAFDLVRLHHFGDLDDRKPSQTPINKLPSHTAMLELATTDHRVTAELVGATFDDLSDDDYADDGDGDSGGPPRSSTSWRLGLRLANRTGKFIDCIANWDLVMAHDDTFSGLRYNEMTFAIETAFNLPWRKADAQHRVITETDRSAWIFHIERTYGIRPTKALMDSLINTKADQHRYNPVRAYLESLTWDGTPRVETCLPGVAVGEHTRTVARKTLVAAVARMLDPGCKWDHTLVLEGAEGLGKSYWINKMARGWDGQLGRLDNKDTLMMLQRSWIVVADEGHSLRKADADIMKEFLTRTSDIYRLPYERETVSHPRHCVIWSTTNDETFLRRQEGNRRFLIVHCEDKVDFDALTDDYVDQVWAEAVELYRAGEVLYLDAEQSALAALARERFVEEDAMAGLLQEYLETRVPESWPFMSPEARQAWLAARSEGFESDGTERIDVVCTSQLWVEALGRRFGDHNRMQLLEISNTMKRIPGWRPLNGRRRFAGYGSQQAFIRDEALREQLEEFM